MFILENNLNNNDLAKDLLIIKDLQKSYTRRIVAKLDEADAAEAKAAKRIKALRLRKLFNRQDAIAKKYGSYNHKCNYN